MMKLLIDRYLECMSLPVFFSISLIHSMDFVATDKSIENSDIFLPVIKHQFFYIADY